jgi:hypothetical protein
MYYLLMSDGGRSLQTDRRSQSTTIGIVLILGITLVGTGLVVGYGSQALTDTERVTTLSQVEHSLTQFDSKVAIVALGESPVQKITLGDSRGGTYSADGDAGWIRVVHSNATGNGTDTELYNESLGAVRYRNGDTTVAYQGGGVWRRSGNGTTMLSQPEFNYRGSTLTLPVIRVTNNDSAAGETTVLAKRSDDSQQVYPNASKSYNGSRSYANPVIQGSVSITVQSEFYSGWANFFRGRTSGNVTVDHDARTATVELLTVGTIGDFDFVDLNGGDGLNAHSQAPGHSLTDFTTTVRAEDKGNGFNNHYLSFHIEEGVNRFEYVVHVPSGTSCKNGLDASDTLEAAVFYQNTATGVQHEWFNTSIPATTGPIRLECGADGSALHIGVTSSIAFEYGDSPVDGVRYEWDDSPVSDAEFNHTEDGEPMTFNAGDKTTSRHLGRHYIALMGPDFTVKARSGTGGNGNGKGAQVNYDDSGGVFDYDAGGDNYITYLHISENDVEIEME